MDYIEYNEEKGMYFATPVVKYTGKRLDNFTRLARISTLINSLRKKGVTPIEVKIGGNDKAAQGTWLCKELYLEFIKWADPSNYSKVCDEIGGDVATYEFLRPELTFGKDYVHKMYPTLEIIEQYPVFDGKYRIDWYIPALNYAIEFDEPQHLRQLDEDTVRQKEIEGELGCTFIRFNFDPKSGNVW